MKKNFVLKKIIFEGLVIIIFSILFFLLLRLPIKNILPIYTYRGIVLFAITCVLLMISQIILKKKNIQNIDAKDVIITILIFVMVHLLVFGMVAITIERAYSVFMLSEISKSENQTITLDEAKELFIEKFINSNGAINKRFDEQVATGTLREVSKDNYQMTDKGNVVISLFKIFDFIYNINSELL